MLKAIAINICDRFYFVETTSILVVHVGKERLKK